jgi:hypothetical protein
MSFNIGGMFKAVLPIALAAFTGGASLALMAQQALMQTIGQQVIQQVASQLGINGGAAMQMFNALTGNMNGAQLGLGQALDRFGSAFGMSPMQTGNLGRSLQSIIQEIVDGATKSGRSSSDTSTTEGKESFLVAFAKAMGKAMDAKMDKMMEISKKIDTETKKANASDKDNKQQAVIGELSAEMQGLSQELNLLSQALSTSVKAAGEAMSTVARKG